jgi:hypothetical protein
VDGDGGEVLLDEELGQHHAPLHRLHEDDHLVGGSGPAAQMTIVIKRMFSLSSMGDELRVIMNSARKSIIIEHKSWGRTCGLKTLPG